MKLLCIDATPKHPGGTFHSEWILVEGEIYNSVQVFEKYDDIWHELSEQIGTAYPASHFIPLSDIDETELAKQREELVTVNN